MYYYQVVVYDYESHSGLYYSHENEYTNPELSVIVQECMDIVIEKYAKEEYYMNNPPCMLDVEEIIKSPHFNNLMKKRGFSPLRFKASCGFEDNSVFNKERQNSFLKDRYNDLSLGYCQDCFREHDEKCPVDNNRRVK